MFWYLSHQMKLRQFKKHNPVRPKKKLIQKSYSKGLCSLQIQNNKRLLQGAREKKKVTTRFKFIRDLGICLEATIGKNPIPNEKQLKKVTIFLEDYFQKF